ncbi:hypothetical protein GGR51DRAFT_566181 [Nemania sp. FL0031]|nr:hypothetical protein GGR51DRAFT_566181 [Nemania sp. FL0031]
MTTADIHTAQIDRETIRHDDQDADQATHPPVDIDVGVAPAIHLLGRPAIDVDINVTTAVLALLATTVDTIVRRRPAANANPLRPQAPQAPQPQSQPQPQPPHRLQPQAPQSIPLAFPPQRQSNIQNMPGCSQKPAGSLANNIGVTHLQPQPYRPLQPIPPPAQVPPRGPQNDNNSQYRPLPPPPGQVIPGSASMSNSIAVPFWSRPGKNDPNSN